MNKPASQIDDCNIICPYCLHEYQAECEDYSEFERREECEGCGKEYTVYQTFTVTHHTEPIISVK
jgi:transcriptional regulator NrdR family protein